MVTAQSQNYNQLLPTNGTKRSFTDKSESDTTDRYSCTRSPSVETCILHLRLLAAFSNLRHTISKIENLYGVAESAMAQEQRWTIFVAHAVGRLERWLRFSIPHALEPGITCETCSDKTKMAALFDQARPLKWAEVCRPPLDILMVLHSYMLNPRDFLQDSIRYTSLSLWKTGFPWEFVEAYESCSDYKVSEAMIKTYEQTTGDSWTVDTSEDTMLTCPHCKSKMRIKWTELFSGDISQMEKGNTELPFVKRCSGCDRTSTNQDLCIARLKNDLITLLEEDRPMPGTILTSNGLFPPSNEASSLLQLNDLLRRGAGIEIEEQLNSTATACQPPSSSRSRLQEVIIDATMQKINHMDNDCSLAKAAHRMIATYDRNPSPFALDLVGAVMRQGAFIEKMQEFDWLHSSATNHHISAAISRYLGFFKVMQQYPDRIAVPTFDIDLIWHTHLLSPQGYYNFSSKYCNNIFIDHDDKVVDSVLTDSFEWTCEAYAKTTGQVYDKCLCWCCGIIGQEHSANSKKNEGAKDLKSYFKGLKSRLSKDKPSEAEIQVMMYQGVKFGRDYAKAQQEARDKGARSPDKAEFFESYVWHYPIYAPITEGYGR